MSLEMKYKKIYEYYQAAKLTVCSAWDILEAVRGCGNINKNEIKRIREKRGEMLNWRRLELVNMKRELQLNFKRLTTVRAS